MKKFLTIFFLHNHSFFLNNFGFLNIIIKKKICWKFFFDNYKYLEADKRSCKQLGSVSTCLRREYIKFCFQNLENSREDKKERK